MLSEEPREPTEHWSHSLEANDQKFVVHTFILVVRLNPADPGAYGQTSVASELASLGMLLRCLTSVATIDGAPTF